MTRAQEIERDRRAYADAMRHRKRKRANEIHQRLKIKVVRQLRAETRGK